MPQASRPVYLKLRDLIAAAIIEGRYREGEMLPSVRTFAAEQGANPLTVAKAYSQFQADGLVEVQRAVAGDPVQPRAQRVRPRAVAQRAHRAHQGVLDDVVGIGARRHEAARVPDQPRAVPVVHRGERVIAAGSDQVDQRPLVQRSEHAGRQSSGKCVDGSHRP